MKGISRVTFSGGYRAQLVRDDGQLFQTAEQAGTPADDHILDAIRATKKKLEAHGLERDKTLGKEATRYTFLLGAAMNAQGHKVYFLDMLTNGGRDNWYAQAMTLRSPAPERKLAEVGNVEWYVVAEHTPPPLFEVIA